MLSIIFHTHPINHSYKGETERMHINILSLAPKPVSQSERSIWCLHSHLPRKLSGNIPKKMLTILYLSVNLYYFCIKDTHTHLGKIENESWCFGTRLNISLSSWAATLLTPHPQNPTWGIRNLLQRESFQYLIISYLGIKF